MKEYTIHPMNNTPISFENLLDIFGWYVLAQVWDEAEQNEEYELCNKLHILFNREKLNKIDYMSENKIPMTEGYIEIDASLMSIYIEKAKKALNRVEM